MDYLHLLEHSFETEASYLEYSPKSRLEYLSKEIFDFTTYDSGIDELFASKALEVCKAINDRTTFDYIKDQDNYRWYLIMCNMPFFANKLEWGASIRGAWWKYEIEFMSLGLWDDDNDQMSETIMFTTDEWRQFIEAMLQFAYNVVGA